MEKYDKIRCKHCGKENYFGLALLVHFIFKHRIKPTFKDVRFCIRYGVVGVTFCNILLIIRFIILLICTPFVWLYEKLT